MPLNTPIQNKLISKGYRRELSIIIKIYIKESIYKGDKNSFNFKLAIFHDIYRHANVPHEAKAKAFPIILKSLALNFYYLNNTINKSFFQDICSAVQIYFKGFTKKAFKKVGKSKVLGLHLLLRTYKVQIQYNRGKNLYLLLCFILQEDKPAIQPIEEIYKYKDKYGQFISGFINTRFRELK